MKILQVCAVDFTVKHFLKPLIKFLTAQGFDVVTACSDGEFFSEMEKEGLKMKAIPFSRSTNVLSHLRALYLLRKYLVKERFDIIHVHTPIVGLIGRIAGVLAGVLIRIYTAHGFYFHDDMPPLKRKVFVNLEKFGHKFGHFIFTQSDEDRQTAIKEGICRDNEILTIGNGVDIDRFNPERISEDTLNKLRSEFGFTKENKVIAIIGRIVREKGYFEFFQAAKNILEIKPEIRFLVIGEALKSEHDVSRKEILDFVEKVGIRSAVRFVGMREDIPELLMLSDIYTLPSYREGMPRSIIEAMAMEKPVATTNIRGCREEVVDGETGIIIPLRDATALSKALLEFLNNPQKALEFGKRGRLRVGKFFSEKIVLGRQMTVINKLIEEKILKNK